jgi:ApbE superfamily uncharacterized protein (UPF0280 family)
MYEERYYRNWIKSKDLVYFNINEFETDLYIGADKNLKDWALFYVRKYRNEIINYIKLDNNFKESLKPLNPRPNSPKIIEFMCEASKKANVGPMASIAGAISEMVGKEILKKSDEVIIENGGDIFIKSNKVRTMNIYTGKNSPFKNIGLKIIPEKMPLGICSSSGEFGHSLSFGKASTVTILSKSTFLADAVATSVCNIVKKDSDINKAIDYSKTINGVLGIIITINDKIGIYGDVELIRI